MWLQVLATWKKQCAKTTHRAGEEDREGSLVRAILRRVDQCKAEGRHPKNIGHLLSHSIEDVRAGVTLLLH